MVFQFTVTVVSTFSDKSAFHQIAFNVHSLSKKKLHAIICWTALCFDYGAHLLWHCFSNRSQHVFPSRDFVSMTEQSNHSFSLFLHIPKSFNGVKVSVTKTKVVLSILKANCRVMIWGCFRWSGLGTASQQSSWMSWMTKIFSSPMARAYSRMTIPRFIGLSLWKSSA